MPDHYQTLLIQKSQKQAVIKQVKYSTCLWEARFWRPWNCSTWTQSSPPKCADHWTLPRAGTLLVTYQETVSSWIKKKWRINFHKKVTTIGQLRTDMRCWQIICCYDMTVDNYVNWKQHFIILAWHHNMLVMICVFQVYLYQWMHFCYFLVLVNSSQQVKY